MRTEQADHRRYLNAYYGRVKHVYDASRKYYLRGRDRALRQLVAEPWDRLIEVGPGTGRNLIWLRRARPTARYGGVEASDEMLDLARRRCPWATLEHGFAEDADYARVLGAAPDRILFSYCLSMVQDPARAIAHARRSVAPDGQVWVVDFGDLERIAFLAATLHRFLRYFHVVAPDPALLRTHGAQIRWGPARYYLVARMSAAESVPAARCPQPDVLPPA